MRRVWLPVTVQVELTNEGIQLLHHSCCILAILMWAGDGTRAAQSRSAAQCRAQLPVWWQHHCTQALLASVSCGDLTGPMHRARGVRLSGARVQCDIRPGLRFVCLVSRTAVFNTTLYQRLIAPANGRSAPFHWTCI